MLSLILSQMLVQPLEPSQFVSTAGPVTNLDLGEMDLLARILTRNGYRSITMQSAVLVLSSTAPQPVLDSILSEMPTRYGVKYLEKEGRLKSIAPKYTIDMPEGVTFGQFSKSLSNESLLFKEVSKILKNKRWTKDSYLLKATYSTQPWLDSKGKHIELMSGEFTFFRRENEEETLSFWSSD